VKTQSDAERSATATDEPRPSSESSVHDRNYTWAELIKRVFLAEVLQCEHCGGRMKVVAVIRSPTATAKILQYLGIPTRAPPLAPAVSDTNRQMSAF